MFIVGKFICMTLRNTQKMTVYKKNYPINAK